MATVKTDIAPVSVDREALVDWLIDQGLKGNPSGPIFQEFCDRLLAGGMPIHRGFCAMRLIHPLYKGFGHIWRRDKGELAEEMYGGEGGTNDPEAWARSPLKVLVEDGVPELRRRVTGPEVGEEFPMLEDLRQEGATDYFGLICGFAIDSNYEGGFGIVTTWTTDRPGGFSDAELDFLRSIMPPLALAMRVAANRRFATSVAAAYLGQDAGARVLAGEIERGHVRSISAVLLFGDLSGFTKLGDKMPRDQLVHMLNDYLACMAEPVEAHGGQVLKFMGDGMLSTFELPADGSKAERAATCQAALEAAMESLARVSALNAERREKGEPVMPLNIALHLGDVMYGNVGSKTRLDFTMVGPAVNEASRMETMCNALERHLLISQAFADALPEGGNELLPLGRHGLRSVREPVHLYTMENVPEP